ncbi:MAG: serine/threonine protein kinase [Planctomycetia bacterium]|nr:serine/threonine protein kinase [Planctomycetia bacterium]
MPSDSGRPAGDDRSPSAIRDVDSICNAFESAWRTQPVPPRMEDFLHGADSGQAERILRELLLIDLWWRSEKGEFLDAAEYHRRFPRQTSLVDEVLAEFRGASTAGEMVGSSAVTRRTTAARQADAASPPASESPTSAWDSLKPGEVLGNYTILEQIGRGGMGAVYKAHHRRMDRIVALKTIAPEVLKSSQALARFRREVQLAARLDHPNIVTAYDADQFNDFCILVMQYVDGRNLHDLVRQDGPRPFDQALGFIEQAAAGLKHAHYLGIVHRDVKPANLLVDRQGSLKVLDLGLARALSKESDQLSHTGDLLGTVDYMAPEQALDIRQADARSDIYSLGCTLYYLLTGRCVFAGDTIVKKLLAHRESEPPSLRAERPDLPVWLDNLFQRMLRKRPQDRFQSLEDVTRAIFTERKQASDTGVGAPSAAVAATAEWPVFAGALEIDCAPGSPAVSPQLLRTLSAHTDRIVRLAWSPNGRQLASASDDGRVIVWDSEQGEIHAILETDGVEAGCVAWSANGQFLAAGTADGLIRIWGTKTFAVPKLTRAHTGVVRAVAWMRQENYLISGGDDHQLCIWTSSFNRVGSQKFGNRITSIAVSYQGVATIAMDGGEIRVALPARDWSVPPQLAYDVLDLAVSRRQRFAAAACTDGVVRIYRFDWKSGWIEERTIAAHDDSVSGVSFSADEKLLASKSSREGVVRLWETDRFQEVAAIPEIGDARVYLWHSSVAFHPSRRLLATLDDSDQGIRIWSF